MQHTRLGRSGLWVSRVSLGTMNVTPELGDDEATGRAVVEAFLDAGGTVIIGPHAVRDMWCHSPTFHSHAKLPT